MPSDLVRGLRARQAELESRNGELGRALEEARDRYVEAYHFAPVGYFTLTDRELIQEANMTGAALLGASRLELVGRPFAASVGRDDLPRWEALFPTLVHAGEWRSFRLRIRRADGTEFPAHLACESRPSPDARSVVRVVVTDISEQVRTESNFRTYVEAAPIAIAVVDGRGRFVDFNPAALEMVGVAPAALKAMHFTDAVDQADRVKALEAFATLRSTGRVKDDFRLVRPGGRVVWVALRAVKLSDDRFLAFCSDITARREAEDALLESERGFRLLAGGAPVGIFQTGPGREVVYVNPAFLSLTGLTEEEACAPESGRKAIHPEDRERVASAWRDAVTSAKDFSGEYRLQRNGGKVTRVRGFGTPLRDGGGAVVGYVGVLVEIAAPPAG
jgi:PAS domain S-box-containing protein